MEQERIEQNQIPRESLIPSQTINDEHQQFMIHTSIKHPKIVTLTNIWNQQTSSISQCICGNPTSHQSLPVQFCYKCGKLFHKFCFWSKTTENLYECPFCFMRHCLPNQHVVSVVFAAYMSRFQEFSGFQVYQVAFNLPLQYYRDRNSKLQLRCIKITNNNLYRYTLSWPQSCIITINEQQSITLRPLSITNPLQRRYDDPIDIQRSFTSYKQNRISIAIHNANPRNFKTSGKAQYIFEVVIVKQRSKKQILERFLVNPLMRGQSEDRLIYSFRRDQGDFNDLSVSKIRISGNCQFYGHKIKYPAISVLCNTHYQPFDAQSLIVSSINAKSSCKKWKCPICDRRAYNIIIDGYLQELMSIGILKQLTFTKGCPQPRLVFEQPQISQFSNETKTNTQNRTFQKNGSQQISDPKHQSNCQMSNQQLQAINRQNQKISYIDQQKLEEKVGQNINNSYSKIIQQEESSEVLEVEAPNQINSLFDPSQY